MKIAYQISSYDVPIEKNITSYHGDFETCFRKVSECGYDGVEIMVRDPDTISAEELNKLSEKYKLEIPMICTGEIGGAGLTFTSFDETIRNEAFRRAKGCVDIAAAVHGQVNVGRLRGNLDLEQPVLSRSYGVDLLRKLSEYAWKKNVAIELEPINSIVTNYINTTREGLDLMKEVDVPSFRIMLDVQHMYLDDQNMYQSIRDAKGAFDYVHVMGSGRLYPGSGNNLLDLPLFIQKLQENEFDGYLTVEVFQRPDQDTAIERSARYLKNYVRI